MSAVLAPEASPFALLQALERRVQASGIAAAGSGPQTWDGLAFRVRNQWCAAPAGEVREVLPMPPHTRIPGAKPWLLGLANMRGEIVPLLDLGGYLGMPKATAQPASRVLVLNQSREPIGFMVDEAGGQRRYTAGEQRHEELDSAGPFQRFALGAFERGGVVQLALSLRRIVASEEFAHAGW